MAFLIYSRDMSSEHHEQRLNMNCHNLYGVTHQSMCITTKPRLQLTVSRLTGAVLVEFHLQAAF